MIRPLALLGMLALSVALLPPAATPLGAQETAPEKPAAPAADELLALNFYVQQQDKPAIEAEMRRLQLKYPGWVPPADLTRLAVTAPSTEIDTIFRQIAAGDFRAARSTIDATRADFPDWVPPVDMIALLETGEGQLAFDAALAAGDLNAAIQRASATPGLLRCDRINNAWRIAEAQAAAGRAADALGTYRAIAGACVDPAELAATLEKADTVTTTEELNALFAQVEARLPAQTAALEAVRMRLLAGRGEAVIVPGGNATASTLPADTPRPKPRPERTTASTAGRAAAAPAPVASAAEAPVAAPAKGESASACLARLAGARSAGAAAQRGWCAYNLDRPMEALADFQTAASGKLDAAGRRDARYGMALSYLKMKMTEEAAQVAASTDFTRSQRVDIERQILDQRGVAAYNKGQYRRAIEYFDAMEQVSGGIRRDLAILRAYAYLNSGRRAEARAEFLRLNNEMATSDSRRGLAASQ